MNLAGEEESSPAPRGMLITSMNSSASALEKCQPAREREKEGKDDYAVRGTTTSYRARLHLDAPATGERSLFIAAPSSCGFKRPALRFPFSFPERKARAILRLSRMQPSSSPRFEPRGKRIFSPRGRRVSSRADVSCVAFASRSHISSATLTTSRFIIPGARGGVSRFTKPT